MNIWRIAGIISGSCAFLVAAFVVGFAAYLGKLEIFTLPTSLELGGFVALLALSILALVTFPYYLFNGARMILLGWAYAVDRKARLSVQEIKVELLGLFASCALICITLWLAPIVYAFAEH